ncbi:AAA family ATPase [Micromonospora sp. NPDC049523]|uniref:AAA family ATPase n=1 Tax=Micromonospora sp. NPDC049523 TaxID=3155921 RepID=UPI0034469B6B
MFGSILLHELTPQPLSAQAINSRITHPRKGQKLLTEGRIAKVRKIDQDQARVYVDFLAGLTGYLTGHIDENWSVGDILFCKEGNRPEKVSNDLWPEATEVGIIKSATDTRAVIEIDGKLRSYPQRSKSPFLKGQTVEIESTGQPGEILSDKPIDRLGISDREGFDIDSLIVHPDDNDTTLEDFGGATHLVKRAADLVRVALDPLDRIKRIGAKPIKGILFTGPSGTGKTHLAKGLANETEATFYNIGGPVIVDQFVGQSEKRLRDIFEHAEQNRPAILFFDEIDSLYTQRGKGNHEATNRLVGQFLSLLDGFTPFHRVIVIATTNLPGSLDDALLRPGRLGHKLVFTTPDAGNRLAILEASSRNIKFSEHPNLRTIAEQTHGWSAADLSAIWTEAAILAALDRREMLCAEDVHEALPRVQRITSRNEMSEPQP